MDNGAELVSRGFQVPCYRQPLAVIILSAGSWAAACGLFLGTASGQAVNPLDPALMRPALDGDPQEPPGFRKPGSKSSRERSRSGAPGRFGSEQALAAGSTGFD